MLNFISNYFGAICVVITALASLALGVINFVFQKKYKDGIPPSVAEPLTNASATLTKVYKMLPNLITFSETMNSNKSGSAKKEFVLNYIKQLFAMMNVTISDEALNEVSSAIDDIVTATKQMHIGGDQA